IFLLPIKVQKVLVSCIAGLFIFNIFSIVQHSFFVNNPQAFSYGASTGELRVISTFLQEKSGGKYQLATFDGTENTFPSLFDNYRWISLEQGLSLPNEEGKIFYLVHKKNAPTTTPYMVRDF